MPAAVDSPPARLAYTVYNGWQIDDKAEVGDVASVTPGRRPDVRERLASGFILADGALGTMLVAGGNGWTVPEELNLRARERVARVHAAYAAAGSEFVSTNSFGGSPAKLALAGLEASAYEINRAAAELAREAVGEGVWVAGSMGPTGRFVEPLGDLSAVEAEDGFALQAEALAAGGADLIVVETMAAVEEARAAIRGARRTGLPIVCTMVFEPSYRTMMGVGLEGLLELRGDGATAVGVNCGQGPDTMATIVARLREMAPTAVLAAQPNAGVPRLVGGQAVYDVSPEKMAEFALEMRRLGVGIIGACCGSTPEHIRAMARALGKV